MQSKTNSNTNTSGPIQRATSIGTLLSLNQPDVYHCTRCSRGFPSSQSLGGHQNAHRRERNAERKLILGERKLILDKIKRTEMNMLLSSSSSSSLSLGSVQPKPTNYSNDLENVNTHFAIRLDKLGHDHNGPLAGLKSFLEFQTHMGMMGLHPPPSASASASASLATVNHIDDHVIYNDDEVDHVVPNGIIVSVGNDNNCEEVIRFEEDASVGGSVMKGKKESNDVTCKKHLDLNLKL